MGDEDWKRIAQRQAAERLRLEKQLLTAYEELRIAKGEIVNSAAYVDELSKRIAELEAEVAELKGRT